MQATRFLKIICGLFHTVVNYFTLRDSPDVVKCGIPSEQTIKNVFKKEYTSRSPTEQSNFILLLSLFTLLFGFAIILIEVLM